MLVRAGAVDRLELVTPDLPEGLFRYRLVLVDSKNNTRRSNHEINEIMAGKLLNVDLTNGI